MSGFEIAGVVLGAIPLIIKAIESFEAGHVDVRILFRWKKYVESTGRELSFLHLSYKMTVKTVLIPITNERDREAMLSNPKSALWQRADIAASVRSSLQEAYQPFVYISSEINGIIAEVDDHLKLARVLSSDNEADAGANPTAGGAKPPDFSTILKLRFDLFVKSGKVKQLLAKLKSCNKRLESFRAQAEKLESCLSGDDGRVDSKKDRDVVRQTARRLQRLQRHADELYRVLARGFRCRLHDSHQTHLLLEHRVADQTKGWTPHGRIAGGSVSDECACFTLTVVRPDSPQTWCRAEVRVHNEDEITERAPCNVTLRVVPPPGSPSSETRPTPDAGVTKEPAAKRAEVHDLCAALAHKHGSACGTAFRLDASGTLYGGDTMTAAPCLDGVNTVTLKELISASDAAGRQLQPTPIDRLTLAIVLTSSILQLHSTPWLPRRLTANDIIFLRGRPDSAASAVKLGDPYIRQLYASCESTNVKKGMLDAVQHSSADSADEKALVEALAVLLLEIYFARPIDSQSTLRATANVDNESSGTNARGNDNGAGSSGPNVAGNCDSALLTFARVSEWVYEERKRMSAAFGSAVSHCLMCLLRPRTDWHDDEFRDEMIDKVLLPLMREHQGYLRWRA